MVYIDGVKCECKEFYMFTPIKRIKYAAASLLLLLVSLGGAIQPAYASNGHGYAYGHSKHSDSSNWGNDTQSASPTTVSTQTATQISKNVPGDNGDIKTHNLTTPVSDQRDEPKVCGFYLDAFNFDNQQSVDWKIVNDTHGSTALSGAITLANGNGRTDDLSLPNGMYKVYWNFNGEHGSAKHKVFKVDCPVEQPQQPQQPAKHLNPVVLAKSNTCVVDGQHSGSVTVTVTNPNAKAVTYLVSITSTKAQAVTVAAGATETVQFTDLAEGNYTVKVYENGCDKVSVVAKVEICPPAPVGRGGGQVLGDTTTVYTPDKTAVLANTGNSPIIGELAAVLLMSTAIFMAGRRSRQTKLDEISL
jgi:hypothetical protein